MFLLSSWNAMLYRRWCKIQHRQPWYYWTTRLHGGLQDILQAYKYIYISSVTLKEGSDCSNICLSRDTYQEAEYFTYNQNNNNCNCKPDINLDDTRESINTQISGNVNCEFILPRIFKSREYPIWQCVLLSRSRKMLYRGWCKIPCRNRWPDQP